MPLHVSYLKPEMMHAEIRLADPASYVRLFHAFETIHNTFSHDCDLITFINDDDGMSLHIMASVSYVSFGPVSAKDVGDGAGRRWTENIDVGETLRLLLWFMQRDYAALESYRWLSDGPREEDSASTDDQIGPTGA